MPDCKTYGMSEEKVRSLIKSWGLQASLHPELPMSENYICPHCKRFGRMAFLGSPWYDHIVGLDTSLEDSRNVGVAMIECPVCQGKFLYKLRNDSLFLRIHVELCPRWPK